MAHTSSRSSRKVAYFFYLMIGLLAFARALAWRSDMNDLGGGAVVGEAEMAAAGLAGKSSVRKPSAVRNGFEQRRKYLTIKDPD